jgi:staphylococcal nuclease domain-containing protein 1
MQRDVEIEIESTDKVGGFIGALYLNKTENAAIELVKEGLAAVHTYSAEGLSWSKQLLDAEVRAACYGMMDSKLNHLSRHKPKPRGRT